MNKKFLSLVLALVMVLGTLTPVFAEEAPKDKIEKAAKTAPSAKVQWLVDEKIVSGRKLFKDGDEKTELSLDKNLQRDEITRLLVLGKGLENLANLVQGTMRPYVDVDNANWANGVITVGSYHLKNEQGVPMLAGYPGNKFLPTRNVTYAELAKMLVCLVDNTITPKMVENFQWPSDWMVRAARLGILAGVEVKDSNAFVTRQAAFEMLYNALYLYDTAHHVDYGTKFGVVSGYANGELRLNQGDKAFTVKLSGSTLYVNNSGFVGQNALQMWNGNQGLWLGSLVRVIADKDGNATHIVELGNPTEGAVKYQSRWYGVADKVVEGLADFKLGNAKKTNVLTVMSNTWMNQTDLKNYLAGSTMLPNFPSYTTDLAINLTSNTRYFVADPARNYLTEVDNATARKLVDKSAYGHELKNIPNVYVGYDELAKGIVGRETNEARIVVFNVVNKNFKDDALVRVTNPSNRTYNFFAENTKAEVTEYSLAKYAGAMPGYERPNGLYNTNTAGYNGQFEKFNVLALDLNKDTKEVFHTGTVIEYATYPSFKIVKADFDHGKLALLTLEGQNGVRIPDVRVDLDNVAIFTEGQWTQAGLVGKYIQLTKDNFGGDKDNGFFIKNFVIDDVISILDHPQNLAKIDPRYGQDELNVTVEINAKPEKFGNIYRIAAENVKFLATEDEHAQSMVPGTFEYYYISDEDTDMLRKAFAKEGTMIPYIYTARVIKSNLPGPEFQLDLKELVKSGTNIVLPEENNKVELEFKEGNKQLDTKIEEVKFLTATQLGLVEAKLKGLNNNRDLTVKNGEDYKLIISEPGKLDKTVKIADVAKIK